MEEPELLSVNYEQWNLTVDDLRQQALETVHPRTRERFWALHQVVLGGVPTHVADELGREDEAVHNWIHRFNAEDPEALTYRRGGGRPPLCPPP